MMAGGLDVYKQRSELASFALRTATRGCELVLLPFYLSLIYAIVFYPKVIFAIVFRGRIAIKGKRT